MENIYKNVDNNLPVILSLMNKYLIQDNFNLFILRFITEFQAIVFF